MKAVADFSPLCQSFFSKRLITQRKASSHTVSAYAQTFRLFIAYAQKRLRTPPAMLSLAQLDASFIAEFLDNLESNRSNSARSRNARLASLRSFYHYAALEAPQHASLIQRVLAIPYKRLARRLVNYLTRPEIEAVLASVDKSTWVGRRNHALLLVAMQTGLRLSEITGLRQGTWFSVAAPMSAARAKAEKSDARPWRNPLWLCSKHGSMNRAMANHSSCSRAAVATV